MKMLFILGLSVSLVGCVERFDQPLPPAGGGQVEVDATVSDTAGTGGGDVYTEDAVPGEDVWDVSDVEDVEAPEDVECPSEIYLGGEVYDSMSPSFLPWGDDLEIHTDLTGGSGNISYKIQSTGWIAAEYRETVSTEDVLRLPLRNIGKYQVEASLEGSSCDTLVSHFQVMPFDYTPGSEVCLIYRHPVVMDNTHYIELTWEAVDAEGEPSPATPPSPHLDMYVSDSDIPFEEESVSPHNPEWRYILKGEPVEWEIPRHCGGYVEPLEGTVPYYEGIAQYYEDYVDTSLETEKMMSPVSYVKMENFLGFQGAPEKTYRIHVHYNAWEGPPMRALVKLYDSTNSLLWSGGQWVSEPLYPGDLWVVGQFGKGVWYHRTRGQKINTIEQKLPTED